MIYVLLDLRNIHLPNINMPKKHTIIKITTIPTFIYNISYLRFIFTSFKIINI